MIRDWLFFLFLATLMVSCNSSNEKVEIVAFEVTVNEGYFITSQIGESISLTASVNLEDEYSYEWRLGTNIISEDEKVNIRLDKEGIIRVNLEVINVNTKIAISKEVEIFSGKKMNYKVVGYFPSWKDKSSGNQVMWNKITHLCYAFLVPSPDGEIDESQIANKLSSIVADGHEKGVYVLISLGGGGTHNFSEAILNAPARKKLVQNTVDFVMENKLDGVDVDFEEWDGSSTGASAKDLEKRAALEAFYKELREAMPEDKLLSVAVSSSWKNPNWGKFNCYTKNMHQYWDFAGIMIYDRTGTWDASPYGQHASMDHFNLSINHWLNNMELPKEKLVPGVPFYGYKFKDENGGSAESIAYLDIIKEYPNEEVSMKDHVGHIFYNGIPTILEKCDYVKANSLGGIMIWELAQDSYNEEESLLEAINQSL